jgi:hypothetical protein
MSTKTSIKRIAAVAAVALTLGGFSAVSAHAAASVASGAVFTQTVGLGTVAAGNAAQVVGGIDTISLAETVTADANSAGSVIGTITSTGVGTIVSSKDATDVSVGVAGGNTAATYPTNSVSLYVPGNGAIAGVLETEKITLSSSVAGAQTITFTPLSSTGAPGTAKTVTITWGAAPVASASYSVVSIASTAVGAVTPGTKTSSTDPLSAASTANNGAVATIGVAVLSAVSTPLTGTGISASITGPGLLTSVSGASTATATTNAGSANSRSASLAAADSAGYAYYTFGLIGDGTSGTSTITITTAAGVALGSVSFTFTGSAKKITATQNLKVLKAGGTAGAATAGNVYNGNTSVSSATTVLVQNSGTTASPVWTVGKAPITVTTVDSLGNPVALAAAGTTLSTSNQMKVIVSDATVLTAGSCVTVAAAGTASTTATNEVNCVVTGTTGAASGATATATVALYNSTTAAFDILATPFTFTIGGSVAKEVASTDAATYTQGAPVALSVTATDASGNAAYDQDIAGIALLASSIYMNGLATPTKLVGGVATKSTGIYAPLASGTFTISGVDGDSAAGEAVSVTATVTGATDTAAQAAVDAANEATDAANAATDAANNAMDSADAAQQAALDAGDKADAALAAVTDLATKVSAIASQIAALSALVKKIAAKVKA